VGSARRPRAPDGQRPTADVFDLDPGRPAAGLESARVALLLRDTLGALGLEALVKTSGSKGLQVYLPLNGPADYDHTKGFARSIARLLEKEGKDTKVLRGPAGGPPP